jgi:hypothetical protein
MSLVVSIDVGSRNLGLCVLELQLNDTNDTAKLLDLCVLQCTSVKRATIARACTDLFKALDSYGVGGRGWGDVAVVLIERQPPRNTKTKVLSHCLQMYAMQRGVRVEFCSAKLKLKSVGRSSKYSYTDRKKKAVELASRYLIGTPFYTQFAGMRKKDDAADALLQALARYNVHTLE